VAQPTTRQPALAARNENVRPFGAPQSSIPTRPAQHAGRALLTRQPANARPALSAAVDRPRV